MLFRTAIAWHLSITPPKKNLVLCIIQIGEYLSGKRIIWNMYAKILLQKWRYLKLSILFTNSYRTFRIFRDIFPDMFIFYRNFQCYHYSFYQNEMLKMSHILWVRIRTFNEGFMKSQTSWLVIPANATIICSVNKVACWIYSSKEKTYCL